MKKTIAVLTLAAMLAIPASATLIGDDIDARWRWSNSGFDETMTYTVGAGVEESNWVGLAAILDIADSSISVDFGSNSGVAGLLTNVNWTFSDLDWIGTPGHIVSVVVSTNYTGWDDSFVTFGDDWVDIFFGNDVNLDDDNDFFVIEIEATHDPIPEPMTLSLLGMGIAGLAARRRFLA